MKDFNSCIFTGRIVRNPQIKILANASKLVNLTIANNHEYKKEKKTNWIDCIAFGKLAEIIVQYAPKGTLIAIESELRQSRYKTQKGEDKISNQYLINKFTILSKKKDNIESNGNQKRELETDNIELPDDDIIF